MDYVLEDGSFFEGITGRKPPGLEKTAAPGYNLSAYKAGP